MGKRKGKSAKTAKSKQLGSQEEVQKSEPHTFVINRGPVGKHVQELVHDVRRLLEPNTATKLKTRKKNVMKDFVSIAGLFHVSHILMFSKTDISLNLRVARVPQGPTLTFKVKSYTLARDVVNSVKKPNMEPKQFQHHPLLVMNNMSGEGAQFKLVASVFQNMFPSININKVKLNDVRRCLLIDYDHENEVLDFRHYNIRVVPTGMSKPVKKLLSTKLPNMARYEDLSEFVMKAGDLSESEAEVDMEQVELPQNMATKRNIKSAKSAIRLTEIGPRMTLQLIKIEEGVSKGDVLYHRLVEKTEAEIADIKAHHKKKQLLKAERRREQAARVELRKQKDLEAKRLSGSKNEEDALIEGEAAADSSDDDDREYYRQEVGADPEQELFPSVGRKRKPIYKTSFKSKVPRMDQSNKKAFKRQPGGEKGFSKKRQSDERGFSKSSHFSKKSHGGASKLGGKMKSKKFNQQKRPGRK